MEELNNPAKRSEIEYATQHFGFPPDSFVDTLIGDAKTCVEEYLSVSSEIEVASVFPVSGTLFFPVSEEEAPRGF